MCKNEAGLKKTVYDAINQNNCANETCILSNVILNNVASSSNKNNLNEDNNCLVSTLVESNCCAESNLKQKKIDFDCLHFVVRICSNNENFCTLSNQLVKPSTNCFAASRCIAEIFSVLKTLTGLRAKKTKYNYSIIVLLEILKY